MKFKFLNRFSNKEKPSARKPGRKKRRRNILIASGSLALALAIGGVFIFRSFGSGRVMADLQSSIQETTVSNGNVSVTIEGTGTLTNGNSESIYVPGGIEIEEVYVAAGDEVAAGDVLATVEPISLNVELYTAKEKLADLADEIADTDTSTAAYYQLLKDQKDIQEKYDILTEIAENNAIIADSDGLITAVSVSEGSTTSSSSDNGSSEAAAMTEVSTAETSSAIMMTASSTTTIASINLSSFDIQPVIGQKPLEALTGSSYTGTIEWNTTDKSFREGVSYTADITLTANEGCAFSSSPRITLSGAEEVSYVLEDDTLMVTASYAALHDSSAASGSTDSADDQSSTKEQSDNTVSENSSAAQSGQSVDSITGSDSTGTGSDTEPAAAGSAAAGSVSAAAGSDSSTTDTGSTSTSQASENSELVTGFSIAVEDTMTMTVSIDELDILSVSEGQSAVITLDAIEDEEFEGEITSVNTTGTSSGGVTKYTAEVTLARTESMLEGMNASVSIVIQESDDTLYIPSAALQEEGTRTYVYTQKDDSTDELSGEVEVEVGNSDGSRVEILSGLVEGDTIYYEIVSSSDAEDSIDGMPSTDGMMDGLPGGDMPSGGDMLSGGGRGGDGNGTPPGGGSGGGM